MTETQPAAGPPVPPTGPDAPVTKADMRKGMVSSLGIAAIGVVLFVLFLTHPISTTSYFDVHGGLELDNAGNFIVLGSQCITANDYQDAKLGAPVIVYDHNGDPLASGKVTGSFVQRNYTENSNVCMLTFEVDHVQSGEKSYGINVAALGLASGFTEKDMKAGPVVQSGG